MRAAVKFSSFTCEDFFAFSRAGEQVDAVLRAVAPKYAAFLLVSGQ